MANKQDPMLMKSEITDRIYVVTKWKLIKAEGSEGYFDALEKFDITDQFNKMFEKELRLRLRSDNTPELEKPKA